MLKVGTILLTICLIFSTVYGLLLAISPGTFAGGTLEALGETLEAVKETGTGQAFFVALRHLGVFAICISIALFFVLFSAFNKGAKWAWWAILLAGGIAWVYGLIVQILEADTLNMILHIVGIVILAFGLLLPVKEFFTKKA
jgi:hypothetical protein